MSQPLLSIGMIVKNEERCLEKCLKALEPLRQAIPCELVIADTGSADKTREIAKKYADIFFDFKWVNDFSKARNAVMDKCSGVWFLTVDADEYLNSSIEEIVFFLTSDLSKKYIYASIVQRNYSTSNLSGIYEDFNAIRMVRMDTRKRYEGPIHEAFPYIELDRTHILTTTIFDHDGYAELSPEHLKQKAERNLEILERELAKEPDNIRCISQCLEACSPIHEKRKYYTKYSIEKLKNAKKNDEYIDGFGPVCAKQTIKYMFLDKADNIKETADWVLQRFSNSFEVQIDINFLCAVNLYESNAFNDCIGYAKAYLAAITSYQNRTVAATYETFVSSVTFTHTSHIHTILLILSNSLIKQNQISEATEYLKTFDLTTTDKKTSDNWFSILLTPELSNMASSVVSDVINKFLEVHKTKPDETSNTYNTIILTISKIFSCNSDLNYNIFENVTGTIGLSVKATNAKTKTEIEKIIKSIVSWEEFMPLALKKTIELKAALPKEFYQLNTERLNLLTQNLLDNSQLTIFDFCDYCITFAKNKIFYEIAFFYNVLYLVLLTDTFSKLSEEMKNRVISTFFVIAEAYLNSCFTNQLLENESALALFSTQHLFSATFIKTVKLKETNPMDYVKTLRYILAFTPNAKSFIEYLLEDFQKQEELKKQQQIKDASPELIALAEQLKTMLSAFPKDSPELLAIKQSPMYKQVAFLIEN